jgi:hypothetical protein
VKQNKKEFVLKMLPVVEAFKKASEENPATTETGENMHKAFSSLLDSVYYVFERYGFKQFDVEAGDKFNSGLHDVVEVVEGETNNIIVHQVVPGYMEVETGIPIKRAKVAISRIPKAEAEAEAESDDSGEEVVDTSAETETSEVAEEDDVDDEAEAEAGDGDAGDAGSEE